MEATAAPASAVAPAAAAAAGADADAALRVVDGVLSAAECAELVFAARALGAVGYRPCVASATAFDAAAAAPALLLPLLRARARAHAAAEAALGRPLLVEFSGLVSWRPGAAIGWHSDRGRPYLAMAGLALVGAGGRPLLSAGGAEGGAPLGVAAHLPTLEACGWPRPARGAGWPPVVRLGGVALRGSLQEAVVALQHWRWAQRRPRHGRERVCGRHLAAAAGAGADGDCCWVQQAGGEDLPTVALPFLPSSAGDECAAYLRGLRVELDAALPEWVRLGAVAL